VRHTDRAYTCSIEGGEGDTNVLGQNQRLKHVTIDRRVTRLVTKWNPGDYEVKQKVQSVGEAPLDSLIVFLAGMKMSSDQIDVDDISTSPFRSKFRRFAVQTQLLVDIFVHVENKPPFPHSYTENNVTAESHCQVLPQDSLQSAVMLW